MSLNDLQWKLQGFTTPHLTLNSILKIWIDGKVQKHMPLSLIIYLYQSFYFVSQIHSVSRTSWDASSSKVVADSTILYALLEIFMSESQMKLQVPTYKLPKHSLFTLSPS